MLFVPASNFCTLSPKVISYFNQSTMPLIITGMSCNAKQPASFIQGLSLVFNLQHCIKQCYTIYFYGWKVWLFCPRLNDETHSFCSIYFAWTLSPPSKLILVFKFSLPWLNIFRLNNCNLWVSSININRGARHIDDGPKQLHILIMMSLVKL